jgi:hypothetical protein
MKKFFALMLLLATMIGFSSCSKEENGIPKRVLVGTWNGVAVKSNGGWIDITKYPYSSKLGFSATFYSDGSYFGKGSLGTGSGTYKLNGNTIKTYVDGELYLTYYVISWTETSAMLTITDNSGSMDVRVEKQL